MIPEFRSRADQSVRYRLIPLTPAQLDAALALCNDSVGDNMYSRQELLSAIDSPNRYFYLAVTDDGTVAGYMYFYLESAEKLPAFSKLPPEYRAQAGLTSGTPVGNLQSIGVRKEHRRSGLSLYLMQFAMDKLQAAGADTLLGVCWKVGTTIPMEKVMNNLQFRYLCDIERFWYDTPDLYCPHCGGRCECAAAVYHKPVYPERKDNA